MSRTDKDLPYWARATWWEPHHNRNCVNRVETGGRRWSPKSDRSWQCDLPPEPVLRGYARRYKPGMGCTWEPCWDWQLRNWEPCYSHPPKSYVDHVWNNMVRRWVRDSCRQAAKEYRATGEVDVIPPIDQHRHCAGWSWS